jgi:hypothetical protein
MFSELWQLLYIHGKMVPVQLQTKAQGFGDLHMLPISSDDGCRDNLRNAGLGNCPDSTWLVASFLLSLVTKKNPSDKTALLKNFRVKFGKCLLQSR